MSPLTSAPNSVFATISMVTAFIAAITSITLPCSQPPLMRAAASAIVAASPFRRRRWNAGCARRRWRFQNSPSEISSPSPRNGRRLLR